MENNTKSRSHPLKRHRSHGSTVGRKASPRAQQSNGTEVITGVLDQSQLEAGYGLGMCVSNERRKVGSI